jgi:hypothetical protein
MQVKNTLAGVVAVIDDHAITALGDARFFGQFHGGNENRPNDREIARLEG